MSEDDNKYWIYAGGLPYELTEGDLICVFSQYGEIQEITLSRDRETNKSRGFCFVKYEDFRSCELAVDNFNGVQIVGRRIKVSYANSNVTGKPRKSNIVAPQAISDKEHHYHHDQIHREPRHRHGDSTGRDRSPSFSPKTGTQYRLRDANDSVAARPHNDSKHHEDRHRDDDRSRNKRHSPHESRHSSSRHQHREDEPKKHSSRHHKHSHSDRKHRDSSSRHHSSGRHKSSHSGHRRRRSRSRSRDRR